MGAIGVRRRLWVATGYFLVFQVAGVYGQEGPSEALRVIETNSDHIRDAAAAFGVKARLVAAVIFVEHCMNVTWVDRELDAKLATYGLNTSLGLGQVKISTAWWIERHLADTTSLYYLGNKEKNIIRVSASRQEIIGRLIDPHINCMYVAAYLAMIQKRWREAEYPIDSRPEIAATLYSISIVKGEREWKPPHENARENDFGRLAKEFYDSNLLLDKCPR